MPLLQVQLVNSIIYKLTLTQLNYYYIINYHNIYSISTQYLHYALIITIFTYNIHKYFNLHVSNINTSTLNLHYYYLITALTIYLQNYYCINYINLLLKLLHIY